MGRTVLELRSERDRRIGKEEGIIEGKEEGKHETIFQLVQEGSISPEKGRLILEMPDREFQAVYEAWAQGKDN